MLCLLLSSKLKISEFESLLGCQGDANPLHTTTASGNGKPAQQELVGDDLPPALLEVLWGFELQG